jgi:hypothetical protein
MISRAVLKRTIAVLVVLALGPAGFAAEGEEIPPASLQPIVEHSAQRFAEAFEARDAAAIAELFTEKAEYIDASGMIFHGRAGQCIGAALEFAAARGKPLMIYVFSDGSLSSNGRVDDSAGGRGKGEWTGDNQQTAAAFFLVFNPPTLGGRPVLMTSGAGAARHQQIGYFSAGGDVVNSSSPAANNVNLLVQTVLLNYMALHGEAGNYNALFGSALGAGTALDGLIAFEPIV